MNYFINIILKIAKILTLFFLSKSKHLPLNTLSQFCIEVVVVASIKIKLSLIKMSGINYIYSSFYLKLQCHVCTLKKNTK